MEFTAASGVSFLMLSVFAIIALGYLLGRITIKGVSLGSAGVFIVALIYGCVFYSYLADALTVVFKADWFPAGIDGTKKSYVSEALKIIENLGLVFFVTAVGFIAGPNFITNLKKNFKSYVLLGLVIIVAGVLTCIGCVFVDMQISDNPVPEIAAMMVGIFAGAITSTPAFSAAKGAVGAELQDFISTGYGIAYIFGVIGVVLFVQLMPKFTRANIEEERAKIKVEANTKKKEYTGKLIDVDSFGLMAFALAIVLGVAIGGVKFAGMFSLTTTGGCLLAGILFGHFGRIGKINIMPDTKVLKVMRELGLILFLLGAGISGGSRFIELFKPVYFIYGVFMTVVPMIAGYLVAKYVLKLPLFNNLGSITGGMTSTPALGTLINVAGTEDVASAYASTYPMALVAVILGAQIVLILFT